MRQFFIGQRLMITKDDHLTYMTVVQSQPLTVILDEVPGSPTTFDAGQIDQLQAIPDEN